jgi:hypothetical protein
MEENNFLLGKTCNILVNVDGKALSYRARILYIGIFHITFIDKFKRIYSFNLQNIIEVEETGEDLHEENKYEKTREAKKNVF